MKSWSFSLRDKLKLSRRTLSACAECSFPAISATTTGQPGQSTSTILSLTLTASSKGRVLMISLSAEVMVGGRRKDWAVATRAAAAPS